MQTTASLPPGKLRALLEQRVIYESVPMVRAHALDLARERASTTAEKWQAFSEVLALAHEPIDEDFECPTDRTMTMDEIITARRYETPDQGRMFA